MRRIHRRRWLVQIMILLLSLALVACGSTNVSQNTDSSNTGGNDGSSNNAANNSGQGQEVEKITIKLSDPLSTSHTINVLATVPFMERVKELSGGNIEFEYYPAGQLGGGSEQLDVLLNGVVDIAFLGPGWMSDKLPLSEIAQVPGLIQDAISGSKAFNKLVLEDLYEVELKPLGLKPLFAATTGLYQIVNSARPIESLEDFKGLKIRSAGGTMDKVIEHFGASAVTVNGPELLSAWQRGVVQGTLLGFLSWPAYQLETIAKYSTVNASFGTFGFLYAVKEDVWNSWPDSVKEIITQASQETLEKWATEIVAFEDDLLAKYKETSDVEFYELSDAELQEWNEKLAVFVDDWAAEKDSRGLPGKEIVKKFREYNQQFAQ